MEELNNLINEALLEEKDIENVEVKKIDGPINLKALDFSKVVFLDNEIENSKIEKTSFIDCKFENCNFSNSSFEKVNFIRCKFYNCKITGGEFLDCRFKDIDISNTNASYSNFTASILDNFKFRNSILKSSYFQENKTRKLFFNECDLTRKFI